MPNELPKQIFMLLPLLLLLHVLSVYFRSHFGSRCFGESIVHS